jgi:hypothetical protein
MRHIQYYTVYNSSFVMLEPGNTVAEGAVAGRSGNVVYESATTTLLLNCLRRGGTFCDILNLFSGRKRRQQRWSSAHETPTWMRLPA